MNRSFTLIIALLAVTMPISFAEDEDEDKIGFSLMESEREREHEDDEGLSIGSNTGNIILLVTIAAIVASVGFTGYKILRTKRPAISKS